MGDRLTAEQKVFYKNQYKEIVDSIDIDSLNPTGLLKIEEIKKKRKINQREFLLLERMQNKTIFQKDETLTDDEREEQQKFYEERRRLRKEEEDAEKRNFSVVCAIFGVDLHHSKLKHLNWYQTKPLI